MKMAYFMHTKSLSKYKMSLMFNAKSVLFDKSFNLRFFLLDSNLGQDYFYTQRVNLTQTKQIALQIKCKTLVCTLYVS